MPDRKPLKKGGACKTCSIRKVKCDGNSPCGSCIKTAVYRKKNLADIICIYGSKGSVEKNNSKKKGNFVAIERDSTPIEESSSSQLNPSFSTLLANLLPSTPDSISQLSSSSLRKSEYRFPPHPITSPLISPKFKNDISDISLLSRRISGLNGFMHIELPKLNETSSLIIPKQQEEEISHLKKNLEMERLELESRIQSKNDALLAMRSLPPTLTSDDRIRTSIPERFYNTIPQIQSNLPLQLQYQSTPLPIYPPLKSNQIRNHLVRLPSFSEHFSNPEFTMYLPYRARGSVDGFLTEVPSPWPGKGFEIV